MFKVTLTHNVTFHVLAVDIIYFKLLLFYSHGTIPQLIYAQLSSGNLIKTFFLFNELGNFVILNGI